MSSHDMHNHWNARQQHIDVAEVVLNVSHETISIVIDDKTTFEHHGGVSANDARMIRFIAEGIAERFNTTLVVNEKKDVLN